LSCSLALACVRLCSLALACVRLLRFALASNYKRKGNYINFYLHLMVLEHIYPDIYFIIFIIIL
jgi:hypothetical protein